jgi:type IV secretory pathway VirB10-like protein
MKEEISASSTDTNMPVAPHFDDERTVQSARPVVPLEQISTKVRRRRQWILAGAFAIAMILGAASALVGAYLGSYLRMRNVAASSNEVPQVEAPQVEAPQVEVTPEPLAEAESVPAELSVVEEEVAEQPKTEAPLPPKRRTVARRSSEDLPEPRRTEKVSEDEDLNRIRGAVLYDEWQERRARRAMRRERRLDRYNHRDLSNLDEIFEGRRRRRYSPY